MPQKDTLGDEQVLHLASAHRRERLVEQRHALARAATKDEHQSNPAKRFELQVKIAELAADRQGASAAFFSALHVRVQGGADELDPAVLR